jgi:hypothetical protein
MDLGEGEAPLVEAQGYRSPYGEEGPLSVTQAVRITHLPIDVGTDSAPRVQFSATVGEEPQVEVRLVQGYSEEDERG